MKKSNKVLLPLIVMTNSISNKLLKNIKGLKSITAVINCATCNRGEVNHRQASFNYSIYVLLQPLIEFDKRFLSFNALWVL